MLRFFTLGLALIALLISLAWFFLALFLISLQIVDAQHDILLKGGFLIDPKNDINKPMDIAITDGKISAVANNINADQAGKVIDVSGLYVTPGAYGNGSQAA